MKVGENMCHINFNSHAKFHGDRTIGGAITVKIALKNTIFVSKMTSHCLECSQFTKNTTSLYYLIGLLILSNFSSGINAVNQIVH